MTKILVINSGSSSIKYSLFEMQSRKALASGIVEDIGGEDSAVKHEVCTEGGEMRKTKEALPITNHREGMQAIRKAMEKSGLLKDLSELVGIGHRVVHGGEDFTEPSIIDQKVLESIRENIPLAPLHNPPNLLGIEVVMAALPDIPQVAVFDTAFHQSIPPKAYHYALPHELYTECRIRRYGFHGTSHFYVAKKAAEHLGRPLSELNLIVLHLGNGASVCAVKQGKSVDTSMGMTPLEGLIMGTRSGDLDPGIVFHLSSETGRTIDELDALLNRESGLKGICGDNNMRDVVRMADEGDERARLAIEMTCYRIKKYIGAYYAVLGALDAVVFTAGIGENAAHIRAGACSDLSELGIVVDSELNEEGGSGTFEIQSSSSKVKVLVIPTDEELEIAEETLRCIEQSGRL